MLDQTPAQPAQPPPPPIDLSGGFVPKSSPSVAASTSAPASGNIDLSGGFVAKSAPATGLSTPTEKLFGKNPVWDAVSNVGRHIADAVTIPFHMITDEPKGGVEQTVDALGPGTLPIYRFLVSQGKSSKDALTEAVKQAKAGNIGPGKDYDAQGNYHPSAVSSVMDAIPVAGPMARGAETEARQKGVVPALAGMATDFAAPETLIRGGGLAMHAIGDMASAPVEGVARAVTGTSERATKNLVRETAGKNATAIKDAADADITNTADHFNDVRDVLAQNEATRASDQFTHSAAQQAADTANQDLAETHEQKAGRVATTNAQLALQHAEDTELDRQHNEALQKTAEMRDQTQAELAQKTQSYFDKEAEVKARVKSENDANWADWREKVHGKEVDMEPITERIQKLTTKFPEVDQILRETSFEPEEGSPAMDKFEKERKSIMENLGYDGDYNTLPNKQKMQVDDLIDKMGIKDVAGEDFDPQGTKPLTVDKVHDLKTQIGWKLFRNEYAPNIKRAMQQIYNVLQHSESTASIEAGALPDLLKARDSHAAYQEGFGRTKPMRMTQDEMRMKQANPDAWKKQQEDARVAAAAIHEPSLADDYKEVQKLRTRMKTFKSDEDLQKQMKKPPEPPKFLEPPAAPELKEVNQANISALKEPPDVPEPVAPKLDVVTPETLEAGRRDSAITRAGKLADFTQYKAATLAGSGIALLKGVSDLIAGSGTHFASNAKWGLTGAATVVGLHLIGKLLESDKVVNMLAKPTRGDFEAVMKLPSEQRAGIESALQKLNAEAKRTGKLKSDSPWIPFLRSLGVVAQAQKNMKQSTPVEQPPSQQQQQSTQPDEFMATPNPKGS